MNSWKPKSKSWADVDTDDDTSRQASMQNSRATSPSRTSGSLSEISKGRSSSPTRLSIAERSSPVTARISPARISPPRSPVRQIVASLRQSPPRQSPPRQRVSSPRQSPTRQSPTRQSPTRQSPTRSSAPPSTPNQSSPTRRISPSPVRKSSESDEKPNHELYYIKTHFPIKDVKEFLMSHSTYFDQVGPMRYDKRDDRIVGILLFMDSALYSKFVDMGYNVKNDEYDFKIEKYTPPNPNFGKPSSGESWNMCFYYRFTNNGIDVQNEYRNFIIKFYEELKQCHIINSEFSPSYHEKDGVGYMNIFLPHEDQHTKLNIRRFCEQFRFVSKNTSESGQCRVFWSKIKQSDTASVTSNTSRSRSDSRTETKSNLNSLSENTADSRILTNGRRPASRSSTLKRTEPPTGSSGVSSVASVVQNKFVDRSSPVSKNTYTERRSPVSKNYQVDRRTPEVDTEGFQIVRGKH